MVGWPGCKESRRAEGLELSVRLESHLEVGRYPCRQKV